MQQKRTLLIVDDEKLIHDALTKLLTNSDYELAHATTGLEALTKAVQLIPDLILLDVMMPDMDGFEVCRRLRSDPLLAEVPLLMVTALSDRRARMEGLRAGADDFVTKPFDHLELRARIDTILRFNRYRQLLTERLKFEKVVEQADSGYLIINQNDEILYANPKACLYLGLSVDKSYLPKINFLDLVMKQYQCEPYASWLAWPALPTAEAPRYLIRPESPHSNPFWLQVNEIKLPTDTEDNSRIIQLTDITQRMSLRRDMDGFHAMVSHKLRTPLIGMISSLELLTEHAPKLSSTDVTEIAQTALKGVNRLQGQIEDILQYLKLPDDTRQASQFQLRQLERLVTEFSLNLGINAVSVCLPETLREKSISLSTQGISIVLWEVLENAKKFHPQQWPSLEINVVQVNPYEVSLRLADDGIHLSPQQLLQVWTPYYQGEKLFTGEIAGMGLGLSMAAAAVWSAGGTCHIYNRLDKPGLVVEFVLPLVKVQAEI